MKTYTKVINGWVIVIQARREPTEDEWLLIAKWVGEGNKCQ